VKPAPQGEFLEGGEGAGENAAPEPVLEEVEIPKTPEELYHVGQEVDVYVMKVDQEAKKIALSIRRAQPERWEEIVDKYSVGQIVSGTITKLVTFGAFARIEGPVEGLVHVSELVNRRVAHPREVVKEGDVVPLKIVRIERDRQRLGLSLRQAHDEAEEMGFVFDKDGRVVELPGGVSRRARRPRKRRRRRQPKRPGLRQ
jgi:ribosomal protein S1